MSLRIYKVIKIFLPVNAGLCWLCNVSCLFLSVPSNQRPNIYNKDELKLLAASALLVQSDALLVIYQLFCNCLRLSQPKSAVYQQAAKIFQQHWRQLKGNYDLNSPLKMLTDYYNKSVPAVTCS
jgi:hypothetical protein